MRWMRAFIMRSTVTLVSIAAIMVRSELISTTVEPPESSLSRSMTLQQKAFETPTFENQPSMLLEHGNKPTSVRCKIRSPYDNSSSVTAYVLSSNASELCVDSAELQQQSGQARIISQHQASVVVNGKRTQENRIRGVCSSASPVLVVNIGNGTQITIRCQTPESLYRAQVVGLVPSAVQVAKVTARDANIADLADTVANIEDEQFREMSAEQFGKRLTQIEDLGFPVLLENDGWYSDGTDLLQQLPTGSVLDPEEIEAFKSTMSGKAWENPWKVGKLVGFGVAGLGAVVGAVGIAAASTIAVAGPVGLLIASGILFADVLIPNPETEALLALQNNLLRVVDALTQVTRAVARIERRQQQINSNLLTLVQNLDTRLELTLSIARTNRRSIERITQTLEEYGTSRRATYEQLRAGLDSITGTSQIVAQQTASLAQETNRTFGVVFNLIQNNFRAINQVKRYVDAQTDERALNNALLGAMYQQIQRYLDWNNRDPNLNALVREEFELYGKFKLFTQAGHWERISSTRPVNISEPSQFDAYRSQPVIVAMSETLFSIEAFGSEPNPRARSIRFALVCTTDFWVRTPPSTGDLATMFDAIGDPSCDPSSSIDPDVCRCWLEVTQFGADQKINQVLQDSPELVGPGGDPIYSLQQFTTSSNIVDVATLTSNTQRFTTIDTFTTFMRQLCLTHLRTASSDRIKQGSSFTFRTTFITQFGNIDEVYPDAIWPQVDCTTAAEDVYEFFDQSESTEQKHFRNPFYARFFHGAGISWPTFAALEGPELFARLNGWLPDRTIHYETTSPPPSSQSDFQHRFGSIGSSISVSRRKNAWLLFVSQKSLFERRWSAMEQLQRITVTADSDGDAADAVAEGLVRVTDVSVTGSHGLPASFMTLGAVARNDWLHQRRQTLETYVWDVPQDAFTTSYPLDARKGKVDFLRVAPRRGANGALTWFDDTDFESSPTGVHDPFNYDYFISTETLFADATSIDPRDAAFGPHAYLKPIFFPNDVATPPGCLITDSVRTSGVTPCSLWSQFDIVQTVFGADDRHHVMSLRPHEWEMNFEVIIPSDADVVEELRSQCPSFVDPRVNSGNLTDFGVFGRVGNHRVFLRNRNPTFTNTLTIRWQQQLEPNATETPDPLCNGQIQVTLDPSEARFIDLGVSLCPLLSILLFTYDGNPCEPVIGLSMSTLPAFEDAWTFPPLDLIGGDIEAIAIRIVRDANRDVIQEAQIAIANYSAVTNQRVQTLQDVITVLQDISFDFLPESADALAELFRQMGISVRNDSRDIEEINEQYQELRNQDLTLMQDTWHLIDQNINDLNSIDAALDIISQDIQTLRDLVEEAQNGNGMFNTSSVGDWIWSFIKWIHLAVTIFLVIYVFIIQPRSKRASTGGRTTSSETTRLLNSGRRKRVF